MTIADELDSVTTRSGTATDLGDVGLRSVRVRAGALADLPNVVEALRPRRGIAVLHDDVVMKSATGDLKEEVVAALAPLGPVSAVPLAGEVHADEPTVRAAVDGCAGADVVVSVGAGTICDIGKVAAADRDVPHVVVQTAASVDGFTDDQSVLLRDGVKRTVRTAWPHTVLADTDVLVRAPVELNRSGLGDTVSMFTAPADWYLASVLGAADGWSADAAFLARRHGDTLLTIGADIDEAKPHAVQTLAQLLALRGIAMGAAGRTAPSSGMEHTVSHLLDMRATAAGRPVALHGAQVGVASVLSALLWARMASRLAAGSLHAALPDEDRMRRLVLSAFDPLDATGAMGAECWRAYRAKLARLSAVGFVDRLNQMMTDWREHGAVLDRILVEPARLVAALRDAGACTRFGQLPGAVSEADVTWALASCHLMRDRFTVADLAFLTGEWEAAAIDELLTEAAGLGAVR